LRTQRASVATAEPSQQAAEIRGATTLLGDYVAVLAGRGAAIGFALVFVTIATHALGPARYADFAYLLLLGTFVAVASAGWTTTYVLRDGRERFERSRSMAVVSWSRLSVSIPLTLALGGILVAGGEQIMPGSPGASSMIAATALGLILGLQEYAITALQAIGRMRASAVVVASQQAIAVFVLVGIAASGLSIEAVSLTWTLTAAGLATTVLVAPLLWRDALSPPTIKSSDIRRMLAFSLPLVAFVASQFLIRWVDLLIISLFAPAAVVGIYAVAYQVFMALQVAAGTVTTVVTPLLVSLRSKGRGDQLPVLLASVLPRATLLASTAFGVMAAVSPGVVPVAFGSDFKQVAGPLSVLFVALAVLVPAVLTAPVLIVYERTREVGLVSFAAALVNVFLDLILIGLAGFELLGAAIATAVGFAVITLGYWLTAQQCLGRDLPISLVATAPSVVGATGGLIFNSWPGAVVVICATLAGGALLLRLGNGFPKLPTDSVAWQYLPAALRRVFAGMERIRA
jgi:O-antigen/teichoic acid export membrane protein